MQAKAIGRLQQGVARNLPNLYGRVRLVAALSKDAQAVDIDLSLGLREHRPSERVRRQHGVVDCGV